LRSPAPKRAWFGGMLRFDWLGGFLKVNLPVCCCNDALFSVDLARMGKRGEFYLLMLASTLGMCFMAPPPT
jgi:NADH:ubiquinone oxidoreductase subunit 2 (subunit N)